MQTSFMHPPFGFALFYLRGIVSRVEVPSSDIYWGAIPWVFLQLLLCAILIFWPSSVTYFLDKPPTMDPTKMEIQIPSFGKDGPGGLVLPPFGSSGLNFPGPNFGGPTLPTTGPDFGNLAPKAPDATPVEPAKAEVPKVEEPKAADEPKPAEPK
jgi:Tripartite ATP-independent periplasmic transporter, DctM component